MPPADRPVVAALTQPDRYLVTPEPGGDGGRDDAAWLASLASALVSGIRRVQFRVHSSDDARKRALLAQAVDLANVHGAQLLVNGDVALAKAFGVGLHLRASQLHQYAERPLPPGITLAASCHHLDELRLAQAIGCDFAVVGTVADTPTHPGQAGIGWQGFAGLREHVSLPLYAIGGLSMADIATSRRHGAQGIAAIRGLWPAASG